MYVAYSMFLVCAAMLLGSAVKAPRSEASRFAIIVPAYNEETELPGTLDSIHSAAVGLGCDYEIVLVNDGSTDATPGIGENFGARVISINCRQIAASRNAGARAATGDIFVFIDADTRITSGHVSGVIGALDSGYVGGGSRLRVDDEIPYWGRILFGAFTTVYFSLQLGAGAFLFTTRATFFAIGGFDETYFAGEEVLFTFALKKLGRFKILSEPATRKRRWRTTRRRSRPAANCDCIPVEKFCSTGLRSCVAADVPLCRATN